MTGKTANMASPPYIDWELGLVGPDRTRALAVRPKSMAVMRFLADQTGRAVTKEQIMAFAWPEVAVTDDSLVQCVTELRKAMGDTEHRIIKTLPKRGYLYDPPDNATQPAHRPVTRAWLAIAGGICALLIVAIVATVFIAKGRPARQPVQLPAIAVLPFNNLGTDAKGDKFADMMTEDVITDLSHAKDFEVIARNSSDTYKGTAVDVREVGRNLRVKYVLEGSVEALPGRVRATAQLIEAETGTHVWSERFEGQGDDVFSVESDLTNRIANSVTGHDAAATNNERSLIRRKPPAQWDAYDAYQLGLEAAHQMSGDTVAKAEAMYNKSIAIDPNFARAHIGLAWVNFLNVLYGTAPPEPSLAKMLSEAKTAAALDPDDGEAHAVLASAYSMLHDPENMQTETDRALLLAPNNADILLLTSLYLTEAGKSDQAIANINRALSLNPTYPFWYTTTLYATLFYAGDFERSYYFAREAYKAAPVNNDFIAMAAAQLGKTEEAEEARKGLMAIDPEWSAERLLTNFGNFSGAKEIERLTTGAKKAGLRLCMPKEEAAAKPNAIHLKECDLLRVSSN